MLVSSPSAQPFSSRNLNKRTLELCDICTLADKHQVILETTPHSLIISLLPLALLAGGVLPLFFFSVFLLFTSQSFRDWLEGAPRAWAPPFFPAQSSCITITTSACRHLSTPSFTMHFQQTPTRASSLKQHNFMNNRNHYDVTLSLGGFSTLLLPLLLEEF